MLRSKAPAARTFDSFLAARNLAVEISSAIFMGIAARYYLFAGVHDRLAIGSLLFVSICIAVFSTWHLFLVKRLILGIVFSLTPLIFIAVGSLYLTTFIDDDAWAAAAGLLFLIEMCVITVMPMGIASVFYHLQPKKGPYILFAIIFLLIMLKPAWNAFVHWLVYL